MSEFIPISEAKKMRSGVNVEAEVKSKGDPRTVNLKNGGVMDVCDAVISNGETEDDQMKLTLWGDDIKAVNVGDKLSLQMGIQMSSKGKYH
jgi:replication factor A1